MLATGLCFVGVTGIVRYLGTDLPAAQSAFVRFGWGVVFLLPSLWVLLRRGLPAGTLALFGWRGVVHTAAVILWFHAMARIPVAEVTAIGYLNPVLVTLGAALFFGEALALRRILAVVVALGGALIVIRPGLREVTDGHLAQLGAACFFAASYLFAKRLSQLAPAGTVVAMMSLTVTVGLLPLAVWVWVPMTAAQLGWLGLVAGFATTAHYCMTRAFRAAPLAVTQPVTFLQLVWATLLGALVFGEGVDVFVLLGGAVIIGAISYITWREARIKRRAVTPAEAETTL
ncbi:DMT family transporter [Rhodobacteraceae bacterium HSP-20]|uniref:DMT family transporter n=2 Tax=Paragemmobacter amnigenus TaxID=2852097 RepID=A0ABS6J1U3_9RHOB|nr:DMT family transporter [Rhodobacter amnigenus]MBU9697715.1 DMT family transporter [Rhodobacter amnigenus]MBV4388942.1 DMT family transporter [Rhodobacter amnigenus]